MAQSSQSSPTPPSNRLINRSVVYLLILVSLLHFIYPITINGSSTALIAYQVLYAGMFLAGIFVASDSRRHLAFVLGTALVWLVTSITYALDPQNPWKIFATYLSLLPFQSAIVYLLLRSIFRAHIVTREVLFAAITVFILLAAIFVPIYGILELAQPGSFVDNGRSGQPVFWQQFIYFSLITLTTTGYGDILPVSSWARAFASAEAVIGVLYIAVLMARLVGLYSVEERIDK
jgi:hypothetical protein